MFCGTHLGVVVLTIALCSVACLSRADSSASPSLSPHIVAALVPDEIKCRVCAASINYIWRTGELLREDCLGRPRKDRRCGGGHVHFKRVHQLVEDSCDHLPVHHRRTDIDNATGSKSKRADGSDTPFDLVHDTSVKLPGKFHVADHSPDSSSATEAGEHHAIVSPSLHPPHDASTITSVCRKWLHERHTSEKIAKHVFTNLDNGETESTMLRKIRRRFCFSACGMGRRMIRRPRDSDEL